MLEYFVDMRIDMGVNRDAYFGRFNCVDEDFVLFSCLLIAILFHQTFIQCSLSLKATHYKGCTLKGQIQTHCYTHVSHGHSKSTPLTMVEEMC